MGHRTSDIGYHRHWTLDIGHRTSTSTSDIGHRTSDIGYKLLHFWWFPGLVKKNSMETWPPVLKVTKSSTFGVFFSPKKAILEQNPPLLVFFFLKILHFWLRKLEKPPLFFFFFNGFFFKTWKTSTFGGFSIWTFLQNLKNLHFWWFSSQKWGFRSE